MQFWTYYVVGVEDVWCLMAASVYLLTFITVQLARTWSSQRMVRLAKDESGATYMLPLVLTMPFYVLLITMIVECTLMLTTKIGSVGAAYAAARAAAVWLPYENAMPQDAPDYTPLESRQEMVRLAAARAMFPYASGSTSHASCTPLGEFADATAEQQIAVFQAYSGNRKFDVEYLKRKFAYAYNGSTVEIRYFDPTSGEEYGDKEAPAFNAKIELTLRYEAPIHTYGIGRLFGQRSQVGNYFVRPVVTTVAIESEGVKNFKQELTMSNGNLTARSLGIKYYNRNRSESMATGVTLRPELKRPLPLSKFPSATLTETLVINGIEVPIYRVDRDALAADGTRMNGDGQYGMGIIYLVTGADSVTRANEIQGAFDDARDGVMNNILHDERRDADVNAPPLTRLQAEIRSDQASLREIDRLASWLDPMNTVRKPYIDRIRWMQQADPLVEAGRYDEARALSESARYQSYLESAIASHMRRNN